MYEQGVKGCAPSNKGQSHFINLLKTKDYERKFQTQSHKYYSRCN